ncbi:MAG: hypothetical protein CMA30_02270 [Euryarchaeota archaeon]|nr:hypothetical protein [Euryarchaeota archaeon]
MANNYIPLSGVPVKASDINTLKNESNAATVNSTESNTSIRDLHDWFYTNAHITESDATGTGQSDVKFSEFYKAQILEADFLGTSETYDGHYGHRNDAHVQVVVSEDSLVRDSLSAFGVDFYAVDGGGYGSNDDSDNLPPSIGSWTTVLNSGNLGRVYGSGGQYGTGDVDSVDYHEHGYDLINCYIRDTNTGAWLMHKVRINEGSSVSAQVNPPYAGWNWYHYDKQYTDELDQTRYWTINTVGYKGTL